MENSNFIKTIKLDGVRKNGKKMNLRRYSSELSDELVKEFVLCKDIVLAAYIFCANNLSFFKRRKKD